MDDHLSPGPHLVAYSSLPSLQALQAGDSNPDAKRDARTPTERPFPELIVSRILKVK